MLYVVFKIKVPTAKLALYSEFRLEYRDISCLKTYVGMLNENFIHSKFIKIKYKIIPTEKTTTNKQNRKKNTVQGIYDTNKN